MDVKALVSMLVEASLVLIVLAIGLRSRWDDLLYVVRRPVLLIRGLIAVNVVVPAVAIVLCLSLPVAPMTKAGLVIMAVSPLAPFAPGKMLKTGSDRSYVVGLYAALVLAAVFVVPATFELLDRIAPREVSIPIGTIAKFVASSVLVPLVAGVTIGTLWPRFGKAAAKWGTIAAYVVLLPVVIFLLVKTAPGMLSLVGDGSLLTIVLTVAAGITAGHLLGGPEPPRRAALAQAAATRHPGMAALIIRQLFNDQRAILAVLLFLVTSIIVAGVYTAWLNRRAPEPSDTTALADGNAFIRDQGLPG